MTETLDDIIRRCEERLLHDDFSQRPELVQDLLAPAFEEVGPGGEVNGRDAVARWLVAKDPAARWEFADFRVRSLGEGLALATYTAKQIAPSASGSKGARRTSIWRRGTEDGRWRIVFHQATKIRERN